MEAHDLIALLSALAVLFSALAAFITARNARKTSRSHNLLIKWGEEIENLEHEVEENGEQDSN